MELTIPNNWIPRHYQLDALRAFDNGKRRQSLIWHRRAGKDSFAMNLAAIKSHQQIATYWHLFPLQTQARKAIWHGIDADGRKFLDQAFPEAIRKATRQQEMQIELKCGSIYQMAGSDSYDALVGSNVKGVIFSEWALCDPRAWDYIRPIIRENNGWALFITTYRGKNHAYKMHQRALKDPDWYASTLTVKQTHRDNDKPVLTPGDIEAERREGMSEAMIRQEYYCDPMAAFDGAFWARAMLKMKDDDRITRVAHEPELPTVAAFDLGMDDHTSILYIQEHGNEVRIIDSDSFRFTSIPDMCTHIKAKSFHVEHLYLPHDAKVHGMNTGFTREETFNNFGYATTIVPSPPGSKMPGIEVARNLLGKTWIDEGCDLVLDSFSGYRTDEKQQSGVFQLSPAHTWESHLADAWQCYAKAREVRVTHYEPLDYSKIDNGRIESYG